MALISISPAAISGTSCANNRATTSSFSMSACLCFYRRRSDEALRDCRTPSEEVQPEPFLAGARLTSSTHVLGLNSLSVRTPLQDPCVFRGPSPTAEQRWIMQFDDVLNWWRSIAPETQ